MHYSLFILTFYSISSSVFYQNITCRAPFLYPQEVESFSKLNWKFDECLYALPKGNSCMSLPLSFLWILPWIIPIERLRFALISEWFHLVFCLKRLQNVICKEKLKLKIGHINRLSRSSSAIFFSNPAENKNFFWYMFLYIIIQSPRGLFLEVLTWCFSCWKLSH